MSRRVRNVSSTPVTLFGSDGVEGTTIKGSSGEQASSQITVGATAQTITRSEGATEIEVYVIEGSVNVRADGSAATATTGRPVGAGAWRFFNAATISLIRLGSADATVRVVNGAAA